MLSHSQSHSLKKITQKPRIPLQQIQQQFFNTFKQPMTVFSAAQELAEQLISNKIQQEQRIISLYLLLASYQDCEPSHHPFVLRILYVSAYAQDSIERELIYEVLIRGNNLDYSHYTAEELLAQGGTDLIEENKEIKKLRAYVQEKYSRIEYSIDDEQVPDFLRFVPEYIPIATSELNWLSPGIISDVQWDNSAEIDKKLEKVRKIFQNALKVTLQQQQRNQLLNSIETDPYSPLHIGFSVKDLHDLVAHNSYIAASLVIKMSKYPVFQEFLQQFLVLPTTVPVLDAIARIVKQVRVPQPFVAFFCCHHMKKMVKTRENVQDYRSVAYTMTAFLRCMFENQIVSPYEISTELTSFMNEFGNIMDFGHIRVLLEQSDFR